ncbi:MAG: arsenate reductase (azurin) small subunit [Bryobacteraceae bacterium]|nr:arsenate reductase (azurin) small subunit [Planctomycetia bacterium]MDZ4800533.1 arsenate reductase (azurin) small subunit [Bryobacteraceae bacterium]
MNNNDPLADPKPDCDRLCNPLGFDRRDFLFAAGTSLVALTAPGLFAGPVQAKIAKYPRKKVALISKLKTGVAVEFRYPWNHDNCDSVLLKLGQEAAGGIGPDKDVVAFNGLCPHMGWGIPATKFFADPGIAGPCPGHWTTFDLTRYGMVVSGHATQGLPQVILELDGDDIVAAGMLGLIFGFHDNTAEPK